MPGASVLSPLAGESKEDLEEALATIEGVIEELVEEGIPSENIVLSGASQGRAHRVHSPPLQTQVGWLHAHRHLVPPPQSGATILPGHPCQREHPHPPPQRPLQPHRPPHPCRVKEQGCDGRNLLKL